MRGCMYVHGEIYYSCHARLYALKQHMGGGDNVNNLTELPEGATQQRCLDDRRFHTSHAIHDTTAISSPACCLVLTGIGDTTTMKRQFQTDCQSFYDSHLRSVKRYASGRRRRRLWIAFPVPPATLLATVGTEQTWV